MILHEKTKKEFGYNFEDATVWCKFYCKCDYCGKEFLRSKRNILVSNKIVHKESCGSKECSKAKREESSLALYGVKNAGGTDNSIEKAQKTWLEKYGTKNASQSEEVKEKIAKTNLEKYGNKSWLGTKEARVKLKEFCQREYGVDNPGQAIEVKEKMKNTSIKRYGADHYHKTEDSKNKKKITFLERYGVENYLKTQECRDKITATNLQRYGVKHALQNLEILKKAQDTTKERYGASSYLQTKDGLERVQKTNLEKYGFKTPMKNEEVKEKARNTNLERYEFPSYLATPECREISKNIFLGKYGVDNYAKTDEFKVKIKEIFKKKYGVGHYSQTAAFKDKYYKTCLEKYGVSNALLLKRPYGKKQQEIRDWLNSYGNNFESNYDILSGKEIDLFDTNHKLGIEYCGLYWHTEFSPQPRLKTYHFDKHTRCKEHNVQLITIFEDEWEHKQDICKSILLHKTGKSKERIFAKHCCIKEVTREDCNNFCLENHLLGKSRFSLIRFGLYFNDKLVGIVSLGSHHRQNKKEKELVLDRLCFAKNVNIVGGASKLFKQSIKWCKENNINSLISWSDNRWSDGKIYLTLGFVLDKELPPDYSYVDLKTKQRKSKQSQKKNKAARESGLTEKEWCLHNGLARIWDCGKKRWKYNVK
jgi:hypothetical protein